MDKEAIVAGSKPVRQLIEKLKLTHLKGKELKNALKPHKSFTYNDWDDGGYVKRNIYKYEDIYYSPF